MGGYYAAELKGAFTVTSHQSTVTTTAAKFHAIDKVKKRFLDSFVAVYEPAEVKVVDKVVEPAEVK